MFFVTMTIGRFPYAMLIGVLISFTALIPVFSGLTIRIRKKPTQQPIIPHVVGNSVGLPAIWVLVAVTLGGNLMGIVGMLIFIPLVSVLYTLFREWVYARLDKKKVKIS